MSEKINLSEALVDENFQKALDQSLFDSKMEKENDPEYALTNRNFQIALGETIAGNKVGVENRVDLDISDPFEGIILGIY